MSLVLRSPPADLRVCDVEGMKALILQSGLISRGLAKPSISQSLDDAKLMRCTVARLEQGHYIVSVTAIKGMWNLDDYSLSYMPGFFSSNIQSDVDSHKQAENASTRMHIQINPQAPLHVYFYSSLYFFFALTATGIYLNIKMRVDRG